ncbi:MAG: hypothetical protein ACOYOF_19030 [Verrucomicrobiaceae bacterium]
MAATVSIGGYVKLNNGFPLDERFQMLGFFIALITECFYPGRKTDADDDWDFD